MSASQRNKGAEGEREVCRLILDNLGIKVGRNLDQWRDGGYDIPLGPFLLEVKRRKQMAFYEWFHQIEAACASTGKQPVVFARADGERWKVIIDAGLFFQLVREEVVGWQKE